MNVKVGCAGLLQHIIIVVCFNRNCIFFYKLSLEVLRHSVVFCEMNGMI